MESRSATPITAIAKIRSKNKWKKRYCVLQRPPSVGETAVLHISKNVKCSLKPSRKKRVLRLEGFYGLETAFELDKESRTLAVICHSCIAVVAFETDFALRSWELWIHDLFGFSFRYSVHAVDLPSTFSHLKNTRLRLHLRDDMFCLVHESPPSIFIELGFRDIRRFGATVDRIFAIEAGTRVGVYAGVYIFRLDNSNDLSHMAWAFNMARDRRLNDYFSSRDNVDSVSRTEWSGLNSTSYSYPSYSGGSSAARYIDERSKAASEWLRSRYERCCNRPSTSTDCSITSNPNFKEASHVTSLLSASGLSQGRTRHRRRPDPPPSQTDRHCIKRECSASIPGASGSTSVSKRERPKSECESSCSRSFHRPAKAGRPLSEFLPSLAQKGAHQAFVSLPVAPPGCCCCRNYVNQPFIESLQYYYNIDHVVLALSKKSKCCDHVCAAEQTKSVGSGKNISSTARAMERKNDDFVCVNVPSKDYAAMAPRGGLYVLMEPTNGNHQDEYVTLSAPIGGQSLDPLNQHIPLGDLGNESRPLRDLGRKTGASRDLGHQAHGSRDLGNQTHASRDHENRAGPSGDLHSDVPPDDPLHMDNNTIVTVRSREESNMAVAKSGIVVKPFEPIILDHLRSRDSRMSSSCRGCDDTDGTLACRAVSRRPSQRGHQSQEGWDEALLQSRMCQSMWTPGSKSYELTDLPCGSSTDNETVLLNYATLATQEPTTPLSTTSRGSMRRSFNCWSPAPAVAVEYAKIDEVATQAARKAIITARRDELRPLSDGEHSTDTCCSSPSQRSLAKRSNRPFALKRQLLRRRTSFTSLS